MTGGDKIHWETGVHMHQNVLRSFLTFHQENEIFEIFTGGNHWKVILVNFDSGRTLCAFASTPRYCWPLNPTGGGVVSRPKDVKCWLAFLCKVTLVSSLVGTSSTSRCYLTWWDWSFNPSVETKPRGVSRKLLLLRKFVSSYFHNRLSDSPTLSLTETFIHAAGSFIDYNIKSEGSIESERCDAIHTIYPCVPPTHQPLIAPSRLI
jgi:hypothetical protein